MFLLAVIGLGGLFLYYKKDLEEIKDLEEEKAETEKTEAEKTEE